ncbi:unnamed protein product (macronuclear) [Paramecium tetraurelia]|uniref:RING-type domain-containing protein n=1 Tax=Paramecium tetraurelia TaxID=5888 RepID=A0CV53_PARTE|nr:uncharacterized protein GSPATT00010838001 [Paramecium tetraurelia]CAK74670.1 unnamed protein product [Paramecium tetraurelia]|eukprot:XP_001442067.1 hypothetical protein (macronuclear) [Paramecium tetraurelia strain d4-2]
MWFILQMLQFQIAFSLETIIEISENAKFWSDVQLSSPNNTYLLNIANTAKFPYYAINVELHKQDDTFSLHYGFGKPPDFSLSLSEISEDKGFDIYGYLENRFTHFILLSSEDFQSRQVYISTSSEWTQNYNISVTATNTKMCPNNCNNQGSCQDGKCLCNKYYIGNDCHQKATYILQNKEIILNLENTAKYAYVDLEESENESMSLIVQTNSSEGVYWYIMKTRVLYIPALEDLNRKYYDLLVEGNEFTSSSPIEFELKDRNDNSTLVQKRIRFIFKQKSLVEQNIHISLDLINQNTQNTISTTTVIIIVASIAGIIMILSISFAIGKYFRNKKIKEAISALAMIRQMQHEQKYIAKSFDEEILQQLPLIESDQIKNTDVCPICLDLYTSKPDLRSTKCKHLFHKECILAWIYINKNCPTCRADLKIHMNLQRNQQQQ